MLDPIAAEQRSAKKTTFLQSLEDYVVELAKSNHGTKPIEVVAIFKENFERSMRANVDYHAQMAELFKKDGNEAVSALHRMQADIYKSIIASSIMQKTGTKL
jgi:hypothetical protein